MGGLARLRGQAVGGPKHAGRAGCRGSSSDRSIANQFNDKTKLFLTHAHPR